MTPPTPEAARDSSTGAEHAPSGGERALRAAKEKRPSRQSPFSAAALSSNASETQSESQPPSPQDQRRSRSRLEEHLSAFESGAERRRAQFARGSCAQKANATTFLRLYRILGMRGGERAIVERLEGKRRLSKETPKREEELQEMPR